MIKESQSKLFFKDIYINKYVIPKPNQMLLGCDSVFIIFIFISQICLEELELERNVCVCQADAGMTCFNALILLNIFHR